MIRIWYKFNNLSDAYFCIFLVISSFMFAAHLVYMTFSDDCLINYLIVLIMTLLLSGSGALIWRIKEWAEKSPNFRLRKIIMIVTLIINVISGMVPRILVFYCGWNYQLLFILKFLFMAFSLILLFYCLNLIKCDIDYYTKWSVIPILINAVFLITSIQLAKKLPTDIWDTVAIAFIQVLYAPLCYASTSDLFLITLNYGTWINMAALGDTVAPAAVPAEAIVEEKQDSAKPKIPDLESPECEICATEYSPENLPKILTECGHSLCSDCIKQLASKYKNWYLECPFCKTPTVLRTNFSRLLVNHALMYIVMDIAKLRGGPEPEPEPEAPQEAN